MSKNLLLFVILAFLLPAAAAGYTINGGREQDGRVITYYNAVPENEWAVKQAVRAWNESGARVEFSPALRGEAELVIEGGAQGLEGHATTVDRGGEPQPGDSKVTVPVAGSRDQRFTVALITAHELGHVLGLGHEDSGCATMNSTITASAPVRCSQPPAGKWRCGLLEEDDVRGVVSLYGGRPEPSGRSFCPKVPPKPKPPPPPPPEPLSPAGAVEVTSRPERSSRVSVRWRNGDSDRVHSAVVARARDRCPEKPADSESKTVAAEPGSEGRATFRLELASACYAVWSRDRSGDLSKRPATAWLEPPPPPEPPTNFAATPALSHPLGDTGASLRWHNAEVGTLRSVLIARSEGRCPGRPPGKPRPWEAPPAQADAFQEHYDLGFYPVADAQRYCYAVWSRDRFGRLSRPATAWTGAAKPQDEVIVLAG